MKSVRWFEILALTALVLTGGCHSSGTALNPPTAVIPARIYFANASNASDGFPGSILVFKLPFGSNVAPLVTLAPPADFANPFGLALDGSERLFVGFTHIEEIFAYKLPLTVASTAEFQIATPAGTAEALAVDGSGNLMAGIVNSIYVYAAPLSGSSTASFNFLLPNGNHCCLAELAVHGDTLAVATLTGFTDHIYLYSLPLTSTSTPTASITTSATQGYSGVAFDANGNLYASGVTPSQIEIYDPPFSNASTPVTTISTSSLTTDPGDLAFDSQGNLYFAGTFPGQLYEFTPPFSGASTPAAQTTIGLGQLNVGIAIGK